MHSFQIFGVDAWNANGMSLDENADPLPVKWGLGWGLAGRQGPAVGAVACAVDGGRAGRGDGSVLDAPARAFA